MSAKIGARSLAHRIVVLLIEVATSCVLYAVYMFGDMELR